MQLRGVSRGLLGWAGTALAGIVLSIAFKLLLGAPNCGLGIVMAVTAVCYPYGLASAVAFLILMVLCVRSRFLIA